MLKNLSKALVKKLSKNPEELTRSERKLVRDHAKAKAKTTVENGVKVTKYPYMGKAGEAVAKKPKVKNPSSTKPSKKELQEYEDSLRDKRIDRAKRYLKEKKERVQPLKFKKGGSVKCKRDGICVKGKTKGRMV